MQVEDRYGHRIWREALSDHFPGYRGAVEFAEGIPALMICCRACTRCGIRVTAVRDTLTSARKFEVMGDALVPAYGFDDQRSEISGRLLKRFGGAEVRSHLRGIGTGRPGRISLRVLAGSQPARGAGLLQPIVRLWRAAQLGRGTPRGDGQAQRKWQKYIDPRYAARQVPPIRRWRERP